MLKWENIIIFLPCIAPGKDAWFPSWPCLHHDPAYIGRVAASCNILRALQMSFRGILISRI